MPRYSATFTRTFSGKRGTARLFRKQNTMQIDIIWLRDNFRQFNKQYFGDKLPEPRFFIGRSRSQLGSLSYKRGLILGRQLFSRGNSANAFTLSISNFYDQTEYQFRNVLLHEMIHLSIAASGVKDSSPHGVVFRGMMARLNHEGWDIHVMTKMEGVKKAYTGSKTIIRQFLVLAIETTNGKRYLSSVNPKFAREINQRISEAKGITAYRWYTTDNRWFENMPRVRSLRGRLVETATFEKLTTSMTPIPFH